MVGVEGRGCGEVGSDWLIRKMREREGGNRSYDV